MPSLAPFAATNETQAFCKEVVVWKRLTHPNVLPLLAITVTPCQLISNWVSGGNLLEFVKKRPDADKLSLVGDPFLVIVQRVTSRNPVTSCPTSLKASATSIPAV